MIEGATIFGALTKAAEKIGEWLEYRERKKEKHFTNFIEPIYSSLMAVHKDYLLMFDGVRRDLLAKRDIAEIAEDLTSRRIEMETIRRSIESQARTLARTETQSVESHDFWFAVAEYLRRAPFPYGYTISSAFIASLESIAHEVARSKAKGLTPDLERHRDALKTQLAEFLEEQRRAWEQVSSTYAAVHAASAS